MTAMLTTTHTPAEARPPRMEPLARLPVFFALEGRRAVVAGGTPGAAWKAELLVGRRRRRSRSMPPSPSDEMLALAVDPPRGAIVIHRRDMDGRRHCRRRHRRRRLRERRRGARFSAAARAAGVPVNVIDKPKFCDFAFGAIVNRSPLVIGISTDGAAPVFGQAIRGKLEALIPRGFAQWAEAARRWRAERAGLGPVVQRAAAVLAALHRARGDPSRRARRRQFDYDVLLQRTRAEGERVEQGSVTLVGAGPGDPELADAARGARAAIRRRHPVRRSGVGRNPRFRAPRGQEDPGRQDRRRPGLQAGRHSA